MIASDKICQPKIFGGLGLRKADVVHLAFQAKLAWKLLREREGLWTSIMKHKYLKSGNLLEWQARSSNSPVWKSVLRSRKLLRKGIRWNVGKGDQIMFWWDNWFDNANLVDILGIYASINF